MHHLEKAINSSVAWIGKKSSWLNFFLVVLICADVLQRYLFNQTYNWILELEWHFFGLIFLLGSAYTFQEGKHVRVDVFYTHFKRRSKSVTDLIGNTFLLIPWCLVGIVTCFNYASNAFYIREGSPSPGGLPAWYVIKFAIVFGFLLILLQGISNIISLIKSLRNEF